MNLVVFCYFCIEGNGSFVYYIYYRYMNNNYFFPFLVYGLKAITIFSISYVDALKVNVQIEFYEGLCN